MQSVQLGLLLFVVAMFGGCRGAAGMPKEWHGFRGGPLHPGSVRASTGIKEPQQVWEFATGGTGESSMALST